QPAGVGRSEEADRLSGRSEWDASESAHGKRRSRIQVARGGAHAIGSLTAEKGKKEDSEQRRSGAHEVFSLTSGANHRGLAPGFCCSSKPAIAAAPGGCSMCWS